MTVKAGEKGLRPLPAPDGGSRNPVPRGSECRPQRGPHSVPAAASAEAQRAARTARWLWPTHFLSQTRETQGEAARAQWPVRPRVTMETQAGLLRATHVGRVVMWLQVLVPVTFSCFSYRDRRTRWVTGVACVSPKDLFCPWVNGVATHCVDNRRTPGR